MVKEYPLNRHQIRWAVHEYFDEPDDDSAWRAFDRWYQQIKKDSFEEGYQKCLNEKLKKAMEAE
jgi:hypothetical protein